MTHSYGLREPNINGFSEESRKIVEGKSGIILTSTHAFGGVSSALNDTERPGMKQNYVPGDLITMTLRILGDGLKVACEIATMAADAGLVRNDEKIISIAGRHGGADTAVVLKPSYSHRFFETRVREIICKPRP